MERFKNFLNRCNETLRRLDGAEFAETERNVERARRLRAATLKAMFKGFAVRGAKAPPVAEGCVGCA